MIPVQAVMKVAALTPVEAVGLSPRDAPWARGDRVSALVMGALPGGRFEVSIGDLLLDMNLPHGVQRVEHIELTFVTNQPRLTFTLQRGAGALPLLPASAAHDPDVVLSDSVRTLDVLLSKISAAANPETAPLTKSAPLLSAAPTDIKAFAHTLREALSASGLFYESHQAKWAAGELDVAQLLREPQGKLVPLPLTHATPNVPTHTGMRPEAEHATLQSSAALPVREEAMTLVQQQLQALDHREVVWLGQAWQGQAIEWRVEERSARHSMASDAEPPQWQTRLRVALPMLGDVDAVIGFSSLGLRIDIEAADASSAEKMRREQYALRMAMEASGLHVLAMSVANHDAS
ncbi:MAG: flagellar hook-length control protein FliK [Usitatibacteraceae bacterium]